MKETDLEPRPFPTSNILVAALWGDADTTTAGVVRYGITRDHAALTAAQEHIRAVFPTQSSFTPAYLFIVTWDGIGYFDNHTDLVQIRIQVVASLGGRAGEEECWLAKVSFYFVQILTVN